MLTLDSPGQLVGTIECKSASGGSVSILGRSRLRQSLRVLGAACGVKPAGIGGRAYV